MYFFSKFAQKNITPKQLAAPQMVLADGGIGILPTDTIYGIVTSALEPLSVAKLYALRRRNEKKPVIVLIGDISQLAYFDIRITPSVMSFLESVWPGKVSVILPVSKASLKRFTYLHRGTGTIAFRLPRTAWLRNLLMRTGPLVAPSANFEGEPPAKTFREAKKYFGDTVDFYIDGGKLAGKPSTLVDASSRKIIILRQGSGRIPESFLGQKH